MSEDRIEQEIEIEAPLERVWALATEPANLPTWWQSLAEVEAELREGGPMTFRWHEHGISRAVIERYEPPNRFSFRWSNRNDEPVARESSTLVELVLEPRGEGTLVRVVESGFTQLAGTDRERADYRAGNVEGWIQVLDWLRGRALAGA